MNDQKITYSEVGDDYDTKDPIKKLAQTAARTTAQNLKEHGFEEVSDSRGESAYVWKQGETYMASVIEGLGTKNLVADAMRKGLKTYYDIIGHDTVATIINDLTTVGANPLVIHAYWAIEDNSWLKDQDRMQDLIHGWKSACDLAGASWGGGETPTMKGIVAPSTIELGGSAVGIIDKQSHLLTDTRLEEGDRIIFLQSNGMNANGLSLARKIAENLANGYRTKLKDGSYYGDALLTKTNIYAKLIQKLFQQGIALHYISNITGHGLRKVMRARTSYTYTIDTIFEPQILFQFIKEKALLSDEDMYGTFNMGQDYALFLPKQDVEKALSIIKEHGFHGIHAGFVSKGKKQVIIKPKNITFSEESLDLR